ncbi:hypothetical protein RB625_24745 [Streptomyces californicus]|uniref:hypothetical protein n=1 Tax=Streptomyces californicus TaxID=67351 RepID=UPI00296FC4FB|nr:hypothetical protein [Streptomyces californicus]MDW4901628.1 hypothetical protein [Streptomyces californicus]
MSNFSRLSASVMTVPERVVHARSISTELGDIPVITDTSRGGPLRNSLRAWKAYDLSASHHLLLQDDIALAPDLIARMEAACAAHPDAILSGYASWHTSSGAAMRLAAVSGASWVETVGDGYFPTLAMVMPTAYIGEYVEFAERYRDVIKHDDHVVFWFLRQHGIRALISAPAMVEHRGIATAAGNHPDFPQHAACFVPESVQAATALLDDFAYCPYFYEGNADLIVRGQQGRHRMWERVPWVTRADELGIDPNQLRNIFDESADLRDHCELLEPAGIPREYLFSLWTSAFLLGTFSLRGREMNLPAAERSVIEAALETLAISGQGYLLVTHQDIVANRKGLATVAGSGFALARSQ